MSKISTEPALRHITNEIVNRMLKLQQLFHQKILTTDLLNQLVSTYVQAIECFDHTYTPMRKYFLSRIQFVVSQPQIDSMLKRNANNESSMIDAIRETVRATVEKGGNQQVLTQQMLIKAMEQQRKKYSKHQGMMSKTSKQKSKQSQSTSTIDTSKEKTQQRTAQLKQMEQKKAINKERKIEMEMNLMKQVSENIKNFEKQDKKLTKQTKRINALVVEQNNTLQARLAMRKKGKNRKKSIDQKFVQQAKQIMPIIQKQQLKTAQKQISEAVQRMTARMTMRQGTTKGPSGLIISREGYKEQPYVGKATISKQFNRIEEDEEDLLTSDHTNQNGKKTDKRGSSNGTARFTLGENGGRQKIKMRDTSKMDEDQEELM